MNEPAQSSYSPYRGVKPEAETIDLPNSALKLEQHPAEKDPLLDTVLGKCHLKSLLGEGGMGAVYCARHLTLDLDVAVKILPASLAKRDRGFIDRFLREARTAASIHHPNIVQVMDVDCQHGLYFLVMEFVEGSSALTQLQLRKVMSELDVIEIGLAICDGLGYAHRKRIVHRDIKPENILISKDGEIKLADMGLAKRIDTQDGSALTLPDQALGTPYYIAPEQARNARAADERSDLYALGATLFHLATGRPPFKGSSSFDTMMKHLNEPAPALRVFRADCSLALEQIIQKAMAKAADDRFQHAQEMRTALLVQYLKICPADAREPRLAEPLSANSMVLQASSSANKFDKVQSKNAQSSTEVEQKPRSFDFIPPPIERGATSKPKNRSVVVDETAKTGSRPSRFWLLLLFVPYLNACSFLWLAIRALHLEWLAWSGGLLVMQGLMHYFHEYPPAKLGFILTWLIGLMYGFAIKNRFEAMTEERKSR